MIAVTGANGQLGKLVIAQLLKSKPAASIVAAVRNPENAADLKSLGIHIRQADYAKPETLASAFAGVEKLLLISSSEIGQRLPQHRNVIQAAKQAGVRLLAYTSLLNLDHSPLALAEEHRATEELIRNSGIPYVMLRNAWYLENHTGQLPTILANGAMLGAAVEGRFASASRADFAAAASAVLTAPGHENKTYELAGDHAYTLAEFTAELARQSGKPVAYRNMSPAEFETTLVSFGIPAGFAHILADSDAGAAQGHLNSTSRDLHNLIGRNTTTLADAIQAALPA
jgi:NAD(P)H dehydrogenase (quinone)